VIATQQRERQQQQKADAEPERADRQRIDAADEIARRADRGAAQRTRQHRGQNGENFVHDASLQRLGGQHRGRAETGNGISVMLG